MKSETSPYLASKLLRMKALGPYTSDSTTGDTNPRNDVLKLDRNENLLLPLSFAQGLLFHAIRSTDPRIYSDECAEQLSEALSNYLGVAPDQILIGAGSDDLINLISGPVMTPNDSALIVEPTFSMYRKCLGVNNRFMKTVQLRDDFSLDIDAIQESLSGTNEVVFLCSPNNPTGNQFSRSDIQAIVESTDGLVVLDEAYVEFAPESLVDLVKEYENIIVLRTFSKAFGLAGMRIGYAVTNKHLAETIEKHILLPYPVCTLSMKVALTLLENIGEVSKTIDVVQNIREQMLQRLGTLPSVRAYPSDANFLLVEVPRSSTVFVRKMLKLGIRIRNMDWMKHEGNYVRVTVPPVSEIDRVVDCFKEVVTQ